VTIALLAAPLLLATAALGVYLTTHVARFYDHFVWQAAAFLEGQASIRYPVETTAQRIGNWFFQDVLPIGQVDGVWRGLIPFPPLPAILLVPFVALFGLDTDAQLLFTLLAAVDVALCWWMLGRLRVSTVVRLGTTVFFAFGTAFWYTAQNSTTWYQAHIVAVGLLLVAVGLALGGDEAATTGLVGGEPVVGGEPAAGREPVADMPEASAPPGGRLHVDRRAFRGGVLLGLASTARLTVLLAFPFFMLVGSGGGTWRRSWSAALGVAIPVVALLAYNVATTGQVFHPAYDHLYRLEARAYRGLGYHLDWAAEDPRYLPQNLALMLFTGPEILPDHLRDTLGTIDRPLCTAPGATRGLFDASCPIALPRDIGMSILLTSPALLLAIPAFLDRRRRRLVLASALAVLLVTVANLMHFSQGWVQFGYRFGNDTVPFALVLVALGFSRLIDGATRPRWVMPLAVGLIAVSVVVNAWGVVWGRLLGW
jgi:hypothetical protein